MYVFRSHHNILGAMLHYSWFWVAHNIWNCLYNNGNKLRQVHVTSQLACGWVISRGASHSFAQHKKQSASSSLSWGIKLIMDCTISVAAQFSIYNIQKKKIMERKKFLKISLQLIKRGVQIMFDTALVFHMINIGQKLKILRNLFLFHLLTIADKCFIIYDH